MGRDRLGRCLRPVCSSPSRGARAPARAPRCDAWPRHFGAQGRDVVTTFEPGDTPVGRELRQILLGHQTGQLDARTEALLYAADRAEHVASVVQPALERGAVCITDRYLDSSVAYQGAGRVLDPDDVERISHWATGSLLPHLTIVLDIDPAIGLTRFDAPADRLESEPLAFHQRVREHFLELAARSPERYLVLDAVRPVDDLAAAVLAAVTRAAAVSAFDALVGQQRAVEVLDRAVRDAAMSTPGPAMTHAWLFTGPPGSGRSVAARAFAAALVCPDGGCGTCCGLPHRDGGHPSRCRPRHD